MKFLRLILVVTLIGFSASSYAITTVGNIGCGKWVVDMEAKSRDGASDREIWTAIADRSWLLGYLSGMASGSGVDILEPAPDHDSIILWITKYCQSHPLDYISDAAIKLGYELKKKK